MRRPPVLNSRNAFSDRTVEHGQVRGEGTAYLLGDTGIHTEMKTVINEYHKANLALLNLWPTTGTVMSAAYALN